MQVDEIDKMIAKGIYQNRSEAIRDSIRKLTNGENGNGK